LRRLVQTHARGVVGLAEDLECSASLIYQWMKKDPLSRPSVTDAIHLGIIDATFNAGEGKVNDYINEWLRLSDHPKLDDARLEREIADQKDPDRRVTQDILTKAVEGLRLAVKQKVIPTQSLTSAAACYVSQFAYEQDTGAWLKHQPSVKV